MALQLVRNGTALVSFNWDLGYTGTAIAMYFSSSYSYLDSPSTTSAVAYKTQFCSRNSGAANVQVQTNGGNAPSTITLLEIAA